jgi:hypothetical protein
VEKIELTGAYVADDGTHQMFLHFKGNTKVKLCASETEDQVLEEQKNSTFKERMGFDLSCPSLGCQAVQWLLH